MYIFPHDDASIRVATAMNVAVPSTEENQSRKPSSLRPGFETEHAQAAPCPVSLSPLRQHNTGQGREPEARYPK